MQTRSRIGGRTGERPKQGFCTEVQNVQNERLETGDLRILTMRYPRNTAVLQSRCLLLLVVSGDDAKYAPSWSPLWSLFVGVLGMVDSPINTTSLQYKLLLLLNRYNY